VSINQEQGQGKPASTTVTRRRAEKVAARLTRLTGLRPRLAMVLGSGFQEVASLLEARTKVSYRDLPGFPGTGVQGHAGNLLAGRLGGTPVLVLSGRAHYYEGHSLEHITFPVRVLAAAGVTDLLLTNAAGGINPRFRAGDFMIVTDHINFMGANPLRGGPVEALGGSADVQATPFVDLSCAYDPELRRLLKKASREQSVKLRAGVYLAVSGPSYETPAEIRAFARLGADAVGMSTVPEVIVARHCGMRVGALSCITNLAAGLGGQSLSHGDVLAAARNVGVLGARLLRTFAALYGKQKTT